MGRNTTNVRKTSITEAQGPQGTGIKSPGNLVEGGTTGQGRPTSRVIIDTGANEGEDYDILPMLEYLGQAYDTTKAPANADYVNLTNKLFDWQNDAKITWKTDSTVLGGSGTTYAVPDAVTVAANNESDRVDCSGSSKESYNSSVQATVSVEGKYGAYSGAFEGSFSQSLSQSGAYYYATTTGSVSRYTLALPGDATTLRSMMTDEAIAAIDTGPIDDLLTNYGTHYLSRFVAGGRCEISAYDLQTSQSSETDFAAAVTASYSGLTSSGTASASVQGSIRTTTDSTTAQASSKYIGGMASPETYDAWASSIQADENTLNIAEFFDAEGTTASLMGIWNLVDPADASGRAQAIEDAVSDFLARVTSDRSGWANHGVGISAPDGTTTADWFVFKGPASTGLDFPVADCADDGLVEWSTGVEELDDHSWQASANFRYRTDRTSASALKDYTSALSYLLVGKNRTPAAFVYDFKATGTLDLANPLFFQPEAVSTDYVVALWPTSIAKASGNDKDDKNNILVSLDVSDVGFSSKTVSGLQGTLTATGRASATSVGSCDVQSTLALLPKAWAMVRAVADGDTVSLDDVLREITDAAAAASGDDPRDFTVADFDVIVVPQKFDFVDDVSGDKKSQGALMMNCSADINASDDTWSITCSMKYLGQFDDPTEVAWRRGVGLFIAVLRD